MSILANFNKVDPLKPFDYLARRQQLLKKMRAEDCYSLLVTDEANVRYLTGFTGGDSYLYLDDDGHTTLISDGRYSEQIEHECPDLGLHVRPITVTLAVATAKFLNKQMFAVIGFEPNSLSVANHEKIVTGMRAKTLRSVGGLVEQLREVKDEAEIVAIEHAIEVAEKAFLKVQSNLVSTMTEKDVADDLEYAVRKLGGTETSFDTIVGAGPRAALPHGIPSKQLLYRQPFVLIDWGARVGGYVSDLTRVVSFGKISTKFAKVYQTVLAAQRAAIAKIRPGIAMEEIDAAARKVIERAGYGKRFTHSVGHGFGMEVHESVRLAKNQPRLLEAGMVVTVEPGIYFPGWGGVRIEDDCLVTKEGYRVLSKLPTSLDDNSLVWK